MRHPAHIELIQYHILSIHLYKDTCNQYEIAIKNFRWHLFCLFVLQIILMATLHLTKEDFQLKVFDFEKEQEWKYAGELPAIIDFYADWCGPCKAIAPVLEELSTEFEGKLLIYKIDTEKEQELSGMFGIQGIPTLLFIPLDGNPIIQQGALPKNTLKQLIEERLLVEAAQ